MLSQLEIVPLSLVDRLLPVLFLNSCRFYITLFRFTCIQPSIDRSLTFKLHPSRLLIVQSVFTREKHVFPSLSLLCPKRSFFHRYNLDPATPMWGLSNPSTHPPSTSKFGAMPSWNKQVCAQTFWFKLFFCQKLQKFCNNVEQWRSKDSNLPTMH